MRRRRVTVAGDDSVFVVWRAYQGRVDSMRGAFAYDTVFMGRSAGSRLFRPLDYGAKALRTASILLRRRPAVAWFQMPPTPLLFVVALVKALRPGMIAVADCHNGVIVGPWRRTPFLVALLNRAADLVLVHNRHVYGEALRMGIHPARCLVLEDAPGEMSCDGKPLPAFRNLPRPWVLFPAGFDRDEPIAELLGAAERLPHVRFVLTGDARRARGRHDLSRVPENVRLVGWVDVEAYKRLFGAADLVLALTRENDVALSAAAEAVGAGKALVLSDTPLLRDLFPRGAAYAPPTAEGIAAAIREALAGKGRLEAEMAEYRTRRAAEWRSQAAAVKRRLTSEAAFAGRPRPAERAESR